MAQAEKSIATDPYHTQAYFTLGSAYRRLGRSDAADRALARFGELAAEDEELDHLKAILKESPTSARSWYRVARIQQGRGKIEEAAASFERAIRSDPQDRLAYAALAHLYFRIGQYERALAVNTTMTVLWPDVAEFQSNLGSTLYMLGHSLDAIRAFQAAISLAPDRAMLYRNLAQAFDQAGMTEQALQAMSDYDALNPGGE